MQQNGNLFQQLVELLRHPPFRQIVLKLLYQLTSVRDERCKALMTHHADCLVILLQLAVHFPEPRVGLDLVALCVNLSLHPRAAELMVLCQLPGNEFLWPQVVVRVLRTQDPLLLRVVRHACQHPPARQVMLRLLASEHARMSRWSSELARLAISSNEPEFVLEALGTLALLSPDEHGNSAVEWLELCNSGLLDLLQTILTPNSATEDDLVLEATQVLGLVALDVGCIQQQNLNLMNIVLMLPDLLREKQADPDLTVQLLHTLQCCALDENCRQSLITDGRLTAALMDVMGAGNDINNCRGRIAATVRNLASGTLRLLGDPSLHFEIYNQTWLSGAE